MKKILALSTVTALSLGGLLVATPASALGGNPTFATSSFDATVGEAFDVTLSPTFYDAGWGVPDWNNGSRAYLDTETCDSLPAGLTYVQNGVENTGGVAPTYQISGTPEAGTEGTYNICFYTEDNPDGWFAIGNSQTVTINVSSVASPTISSSVVTVSSGESVTINVADVTEGSWVGWFINGVYVDGANASSFPQTVAYSDFTFENPATDNVVTWALYDSPQLEATIANAISTVAVTWTATATAPDYTINCGDPQSAPYTNLTPDGDFYGNYDVNFDGTAEQSVTVKVENCNYHLAQDINGTYNAYVGQETVSTYTVTVPVDGVATVSGYNTSFGTPTNVRFGISFYNAGEPTPEEPINGDIGSCGTTQDINNADAYFEGICTGSADVSDAGTANTSDAYDGFADLYGVNWDGSTFNIGSTGIINDEGGIFAYVSSNIWSHDAQEYVDVYVNRTFIGNTAKWEFEVYATGTMTPSTLTVYFDGNLGSDGSTTWTTSNGYTVSTEDGTGGDPAIIWNTTGEMTYSENDDDVRVDFANASSGSLSHILLGYEDCITTTQLMDAVDVITASYNTYVDANIPDVAGDCSVEFTVNGSGTFVNGIENNVDFTVTPSGAWNWSYGGGIDIEGLPNGLSYDVTNSWVEDEIPSFTIYGTADAEPGEYTVTVYLSDDYSGSASSTFTITVEEAPAPTMTVSPETFSAVVGDEVDVTLDITTTGLNFGEGFEGSVEGLPAGMDYEFITDEEGNITGLRIFGIAEEAATGALNIVITDMNFDSAENNTVTWEITAAPVVVEVELALDRTVGQSINGAGADYAAEGLKEGTEWSLTLRSTPQVIASGTVDATGIIGGLAMIPSGLEAGWHSITLTGTDVNGNAVSKVVWFELSANGTIMAVQDNEPAPEPKPAEPALAHTGFAGSDLLFGALATLLAGVGIIMFGAYRNSKIETK